jgi:hypothetical protein
MPFGTKSLPVGGKRPLHMSKFMPVLNGHNSGAIASLRWPALLLSDVEGIDELPLASNSETGPADQEMSVS